MHLNLVLLLAVCSNVVTAGLVRRGAFSRSGIYPRAFNQSSVPGVGARAHDHTSDISRIILSTSSVSSSTSTTPGPTSKQIGSVPAEAQGINAASLPASEVSVANTEPPKPLSTVPLALSTASQPSHATSSSSATKQKGTSSSFTSKQVGAVPVAGSGPGAATVAPKELSSANTKPPNPLSTPALTPSKEPSAILTSEHAGSATSSRKVASRVEETSFSRRFTLVTGASSKSIAASPASETKSAVAPLSASKQSLTNTVARATSTLAQTNSTKTEKSVGPNLDSLTPSPSSSKPLSPSSSQTEFPTITGGSTAQNGNIAMAISFNSFFKMMALDSACSPGLESQVAACINDRPARCGADRKYFLSSCPQNQKCYALPLEGGQTGITIQCALPGDALAKLGQSNPSDLPESSSTPDAATIESSSQISSTLVETPTSSIFPTKPRSSQEVSPSRSSSTIQAESTLSKTSPTDNPSSTPSVSVESLSSGSFSIATTQTSTQSIPRSTESQSSGPFTSEVPLAKSSETSASVAPTTTDQPAIIITPLGTSKTSISTTETTQAPDVSNNGKFAGALAATGCTPVTVTVTVHG